MLMRLSDYLLLHKFFKSAMHKCSRWNLTFWNLFKDRNLQYKDLLIKLFFPESNFCLDFIILWKKVLKATNKANYCQNKRSDTIHYWWRSVIAQSRLLKLPIPWIPQKWVLHTLPKVLMLYFHLVLIYNYSDIKLKVKNKSTFDFSKNARLIPGSPR